MTNDTNTNTQRTIPSVHRCAYPAPSRVWEQTASGAWTSRDWKRGEKERYEAEVLGR